MEIPATPFPQPDQVEMSIQYELMDLDIPTDMSNLIDVPEQVLSDSDAWAHSVLDYEW